MIIKKGLKNFFLATLTALAFSSCAPDPQSNTQPNEGVKYAILSNGVSEVGFIDPIDVNSTLIATTNVYNELLENGYSKENIFVLYNGGKPNFDKIATTHNVGPIKTEFDGSYDNTATASNLTDILESLEDKVKEEDKVTINIMSHGSPSGIIYFDYDLSNLSGTDLTQIIEGNKSEEILLVVGTCHSESFGYLVEFPSTIVASAYGSKLSWGDKNYSFNTVFWEEMNNKANDMDRNGEITPHEAFSPTKERAISYGKEIEDFLKNDYEGIGARQEDLDMLSFVPVYIQK